MVAVQQLLDSEKATRVCLRFDLERDGLSKEAKDFRSAAKFALEDSKD